MYGPYKAEAGEGRGPNGSAPFNWNAYPDVELPPGTYTVVDSDPGSWAWDGGSKGRGMTEVEAAK